MSPPSSPKSAIASQQSPPAHSRTTQPQDLSPAGISSNDPTSRDLPSANHSRAPCPSSTSPQVAPLPNTSTPRRTSRVNHSPRGRIDSILEGARQRKVAMHPSDENGGAARLRGAQREEHESSADEETSIFRRSAREMNYQATAAASQAKDARREREREDTGGAEHESWWARILSEYGSVELENKGSVARDHLALERTFLAWLRTSLAFASIGIAITQLFRLNTTSAGAGSGDPYKHLRQMGKPLGATFLGISIVMLGVGFHRYFEGQHWIIRGKFPASRGSIALVALITLALMVTSLVVVIVVEPAVFEK